MRNGTGPAAVQLRVSGASLEEVAETLDLANARAALTVIERELARQGEENKDARDRLRMSTNVLLEDLIWSVYGKATNADDPEHLLAVRTMVTVLDRRAKLNGLDEPTRHEIHTPTQTELDRWVAEVVKGAMPDLPEADADDLLGITDGEVIYDSEDDAEAVPVEQAD